MGHFSGLDTAVKQTAGAEAALVRRCPMPKGEVPPPASVNGSAAALGQMEPRRENAPVAAVSSRRHSCRGGAGERMREIALVGSH